MSIFASILRSVYKLSGAKKAFALPEDALRKEIEKQNRHRGVFTPTDRKAYYETIAVNGFPCLIVREHPKPSERAILYPTSFKVDFVGQPYEGACYYRITRCPICIYTEKLGVSELMPLFCELDEVMITLQHGVLHRKQTLANGGEYCDYFITGNRE